jgi:hypothetical protein
VIRCIEIREIINRQTHKGIILLKYNKNEKTEDVSACPDGIPIQPKRELLSLFLHLKSGRLTES